ncbi:MAG: hypothetical protein ACE5GN_06260 [Waddliaceae bacterium]
MNATKIMQRAAKIKGLMVTKCFKQADIAKALRVDRRALSQCLNINPKTGDFILKDPYIREGIARYLKLPYRSVWGEDPIYTKPKMRRSPFFLKS